MPKATAICYLSSLLFYGMGYAKMLVLNAEHMNTDDYTIYVSQATAYFVLTIFLAVIGSLFFYVKIFKGEDTLEIHNIKYRVKATRGSYNRKRVSIPEVKVQLSQSKYYVDLESRKSS